MGLKVLSLFDGIACGMQAFKELGIPIDVYYASEIEKNAIKVAKANHPEIIEIGDVTEINFSDYIGKVDIIIGGSPCQGFSVCGKQLAFLDERSALIKYFFEAIETIKPKYFLLENVVMQKRYEHNIDEVLGVKAIRINSALVSVQQRVRLYWTNIPGVTQPKQIPNLNVESLINRYGDLILRDSIPQGVKHILKEEPKEPVDRCYYYGYTGNSKNQSTTLYSAKGKFPTLTLNNSGNRYIVNGKWKALNSVGFELLQGLPINYTKYAGEGGHKCREPLIGNGWCVPVIKHIFSFIPKEDYGDAKEGS